MEWTVVLAAVVGGVVGVGGSLAGVSLTLRHERRIRWDDERASAIGSFAEAAARLEGRHFRRGQSIAGGDPAEVLNERQRVCDEDYDQLFAKAARIRALLPTVASFLDPVFETERQLRLLADGGVPDSGHPGWRPARDALRAAINDLAAAAGNELDTKRAPASTR